MLALDVGQGSAILVRTAQDDLLFDAGPGLGNTDAGERVITPALRALGVRKLAALVVSHADLDHAGGLSGLLSAMPVARAYASFDLPAVIRRQAARRGGATEPGMPGRIDLCERGMLWQSGGVTFEFLHPPPAEPAAVAKSGGSNARSCVLRMTGTHHSALLTGDIGTREERALIDAHVAQANLVVVAHHGSRTSSSAGFVAAAQAAHAIIQVGRHNRFGHPQADVLRRWTLAGAAVWRTDLQGAIAATSGSRALEVQAQRLVNRRYWHGQ